ncbi:FAD binding domain-containing protein [Streptomyces sp. NPDC048664]|uniref:FAD binding domain-containing protein n=1 Tax=Streptomyces sp. NPDC048664 TaxID=3154505 RepID=UPI0034225ADE
MPGGRATLVWASWQRDGFPERAMSLRDLPEATRIGNGELGAAVVLHRIDDRVPETLRRAAALVGTGAVRRAATVGGNLVGSSLRCLLPAALVLDARAVTLDREGVEERELAEVVDKHPLLLGLRWHPPAVSAYDKQEGAPSGPPPLVIASAAFTDGTDGEDGHRIRVAVRDGYEVLTGTAARDAGAGADQVLRALRATAIGELHSRAWEAACRQVSDLVDRLGG